MRASTLLRAVFLPALVLLPFLSASITQARNGTASSYGIRLSVVVPRQTYPRNALVQVTIRVQNISHHPVKIYRDACPNGSLFAQVVNAAGRVLYPPAISGDAVPDCPAPVATSTLRPGQAFKRHTLVILRANRLVPVGMLPVNGTYVYGQPVTVQLTSGVPPAIVLRVTPHLHAIIRPTTRQQHSRLYYSDGGSCPPKGKAVRLIWGTVGWKGTKPSTSGTYLIRPKCQHPLAWNFVAGWLGQPVATMYFEVGLPSPKATPTPTAGVSVSFPPAVAPVRVHVGEDLTLRVPLVNKADPAAGAFWLAKADAGYLKLLAAGPLPDSSVYVYRWRAISPGNTIIVLDPACLQHGCALPSYALRVTILG